VSGYLCVHASSLGQRGAAAGYAESRRRRRRAGRLALRPSTVAWRSGGATARSIPRTLDSSSPVPSSRDTRPARGTHVKVARWRDEDAVAFRGAAQALVRAGKSRAVLTCRRRRVDVTHGFATPRSIPRTLDLSSGTLQCGCGSARRRPAAAVSSRCSGHSSRSSRSARAWRLQPGRGAECLRRGWRRLLRTTVGKCASAAPAPPRCALFEKGRHLPGLVRVRYTTTSRHMSYQSFQDICRRPK